MALRPYPGFVGPSYTSQSKIAAYDRTVNWYPERIESGTGTARYALYPTPGFANFVTLGDAPGRGGLSIGGTSSSGSISGNTYLVAGSTLYQYPSTTLATGIVNGSDGFVEMVTNGDQGHQLLFSSDSTSYCFDTDTNVLTSVGVGHSVAFLNGYGLRLDQFENKFYFSASFDFSTWDPLDVVAREDASDNWVKLVVYHKEVWLLGARTTSIYYNGDNPDTPFQPIQSAFMNVGIVAPNSACIVAGSLMWIGQDAGGNGVVYRANGYSPERISTHPVEDAFQLIAADGSGGLLDAEGTYYQRNGHDFYELTLPPRDPSTAVGATWVYDATEGLWSERGNWNGLVFACMDTRGYFVGPDISLSRTSGKIYTVFPTHFLGTSGDPIVRLRRAPHILSAQYRIRYSHLRVLMETGITTVVPPTAGSDPTIALRWSDDGGQTWGNTVTTSVGATGEYSRLVDFWQLGQARDRVFEFRVSDPVPYRLVDCYVDYSVGVS